MKLNQHNRVTLTKPWDVAGFGLPTTESDRLQRLVTAALKSRWVEPLADPQLLYWHAPYFRLDRVTVFQTASAEEQFAILRQANQGLLEEAYFIEKAGMGYMAKMLLMAETTEERLLYSLFAADEASHFAQIAALLPVAPLEAQDPFLQLLRQAIDHDDKQVLLFVIQIVLEGWGLSHYRSLAQGCSDRTLTALLTDFLQAEARHHHAGVTLLSQQAIDASSQTTMVELLTTLLRMVQVGPQRVLGAIAQVKGHLSRSQQVQVLEELETEFYSGKRLKLLRDLMRGKAADKIVRSLEERGAFEPLSADRCV